MMFGLSQFEMLMLMLVGGSLATFRLAHALVYEKGFMAIFERIRALAGVRIVRVPYRDTLGNMQEMERTEGDTTLSEIFTCYYCCSMWVAMPFGLLLALSADYRAVDESARLIYFLLTAFVGWLAICGAALVWKRLGDAQ